VSKPLSPAAQAVMDAAACVPIPDQQAFGILRLEIAAALCAATDHGEYMVDPVDGKTAVVRVSDLESWAAELEALNG